ncbi:unnamed protein product, partial [Ectocarpus fasciculatus]
DTAAASVSVPNSGAQPLGEDGASVRSSTSRSSLTSRSHCRHPGCRLKATFGVQTGSRMAELCSKHSKDEMVNFGVKTCAHPTC